MPPTSSMMLMPMRLTCRAQPLFRLRKSISMGMVNLIQAWFRGEIDSPLEEIITEMGDLLR